jgi:hypothetical protein
MAIASDCSSRNRRQSNIVDDQLSLATLYASLSKPIDPRPTMTWNIAYLMLAFLGGVLVVGVVALAGGFTVLATDFFASLKLKQVLKDIEVRLASIERTLGKMQDRLDQNPTPPPADR